jgi:arylsulfatase A-like enzyme
VFILTDDQGAWTLGSAGNEEIRTPNLDRLADRGTRFENFYCVTPVCSAARASILTGTIPSRHGVHDFLCGSGVGGRDDVDYLAGRRCYPEVLAEAGYTCGHAGKWHLGDASFAQKGFSFWRPLATTRHNDPVFYDGTGNQTQERGYTTDLITNHALSFLDGETGAATPFYLSVCYYAPHSPWYRGEHPAELFDDYYDNCPFESAPNENKSAIDAGLTDFFDAPEVRREKLSGYYASITAMDAAVGRIVARLDDLGIRENTVIVFTGDNGMNMGHHGICGKGNGTIPLNLFETSVKVPCIVSAPGRLAEKRVERGLFSHYDLFPTMTELAGLGDDHDPSRPGGSLLPFLEGRVGVESPDRPVYVFDEYGYARMVRADRWKYIERTGDWPCEFYDLADDPREQQNLLAEPDASGTRDKLAGELHEWFARYVDPHLDGTLLPVTGHGQLDLATHENAFAQAWPAQWIAASEARRRDRDTKARNT